MKILSGNFLMNVFVMVCSGAIGAFILQYLTTDITNDKIIPWAIITLVLVPVPFILPAIQNSKELLESDSITESEFNRLKDMISNNSAFLKAALFFSLISALATGLSLYFLGVRKLMPVDVFTLIGGLYGAEIYIIYYLLATRENIQNFKAKAIKRKNDLINKRKAIKRLETTKK